MVKASEFRFLPAQADELGLSGPLPMVRRVSLTPTVSGLVWDFVPVLDARPATTVFLHGAALNAHTWDDTLLVLASRLGLSSRPASEPQREPSDAGVSEAGFIALDLPGHGDSAWRADGLYGPDLIAPDVVEALVAAQAGGLLASKFSVVGQSMGGLTGLEIARLTSDLKSLILVDILPLSLESASALASFLDGSSQFDSREQIVERALAFGLGGSPRACMRGVELNTRVREDGVVEWKHHLGRLGSAGLRLPDPERAWDLIGSGTPHIELVLATNSVVEEESVARLEKIRPGVRIHRIAGGHNLQEDAPEALAGRLETSLASSG